MSVEVSRKSEVVLVVNPNTMAVNSVFKFSYSEPIDEDVMMGLRSMLGLGESGGKGLNLPPEERGRIATILLQNNFLTPQEVGLLGGQIIKTNI